MRKNKSQFLFLSYLSGLSMIGFLATDMYLPAFGSMQEHLNTKPENISSTLSIFLGGYAIAQLLWGPISDRFGKKKILLVGLSFFVLTSLLISITSSIIFILFLRLLQAIGACAAAVSWQALVIDRYPKEESKQVFATIMPLVALSPALAPLLGAFLLDCFGWRMIFIVLALIGLGLVLSTFFIKDEKNKDNSENKDIKENTENKGYLYLLKSRIFLGNVMIYAFCSASFFGWLTGSPFILKNLGYSPSVIGLSYFPQTLAFLCGGYGYKFISKKISNKIILPKILIVYSICMLVMFLITIFLTPNLIILLIPFCCMAFVNGACYPIVVSEALTPFSSISGKASALLNTLQLGGCFLASFIVSIFSTVPLLSTTSVMLSTVFFVWLGYYMRR